MRDCLKNHFLQNRSFEANFLMEREDRKLTKNICQIMVQKNRRKQNQEVFQLKGKKIRSEMLWKN